MLLTNCARTHFIVFGPVSNDNIDTIIFDDHIVKQVNEIRYLGIIIADHLCWKSHINCVRDKVAKGVGMLKMSHMCLPKQYLLTIYDSFIQSYLQYGIEFWGSTYTTYLQPLRVLQKRSIRLICHVDILIHCAPLAYNLGLLLLDDLFFYSTACIMFKVANNLSPDVASFVY